MTNGLNIFEKILAYLGIVLAVLIVSCLLTGCRGGHNVDEDIPDTGTPIYQIEDSPTLDILSPPFTGESVTECEHYWDLSSNYLGSDGQPVALVDTYDRRAPRTYVLPYEANCMFCVKLDRGFELWEIEDILWYLLYLQELYNVCDRGALRHTAEDLFFIGGGLCSISDAWIAASHIDCLGDRG